LKESQIRQKKAGPQNNQKDAAKYASSFQTTTTISHPMTSDAPNLKRIDLRGNGSSVSGG